MPLTRPTLTELISRIAGDIKNSFTGATTLALRSTLRVLGRVLAGAAHGIYDYIDNIVQQLFASTATDNFLDTLGSEIGVIRKAATQATGIVVATGTVGTTIPAGSTLTSPSGIEYTVDSATDIGALGTADVDITAVNTGADGNELAGVILRFSSPISNVDSETTIDTDGLSGGTDEETDDTYRARILARKRFPISGGTASDLEAWALEVSGVTRAWVYEEYYGAGTVAVYFVRDDDASIIPDATEIATVLAYLIEHDDPTTGITVGIPVTMKPGLFILAPTTVAVNYDIDIYPNTAAVQANVTAAIEEYLLRAGGPQLTLYLSDLGAAISSASGVSRYRINTPAADTAMGVSEVPIVGTITYHTYV